MNPIRERTKEQFPSVLLTLLSIVQALALGMLWTHIEESPFLFEATLAATFYWSQVAITFLAMLLIWLMYVNTVMRFRWVPSIIESLLPFFIGLMEFVLVDSMGPNAIGVWFLMLAAISAITAYSGHQTFVRARCEKENESFFENVSPATYHDYLPVFVAVIIFSVTGLTALQADGPNILSTLTLVGAFAFVLMQLIGSAKWWQNSLRESKGEGQSDTTEVAEQGKP